MASPASGPSRPTSARRPPSAPSRRAKKSNGRAAGAPPPRRELRLRRGEARIGGERGGERALAARREPHQRLVVEADQRRFQHARRAPDRRRGCSAARAAAQRSSTAIWRPSVSRSAPAAGDAGAPQRPRHRLEQRPARAHQDQNVAGRGSAAARPSSGSTMRSGEPGAIHCAITPAMRSASALAGWVQLLRVERRRPVAGLGRRARRRAAARPRRRRAGCRGSANAASASASPALTPFQTSGVANTLSTASSTTGAERNEWVSRTSAKARSRLLVAAREEAPHRVEQMRRGALEREDRLLLVADREERARRAAARLRR